MLTQMSATGEVMKGIEFVVLLRSRCCGFEMAEIRHALAGGNEETRIEAATMPLISSASAASFRQIIDFTLTIVCDVEIGTAHEARYFIS